MRTLRWLRGGRPRRHPGSLVSASPSCPALISGSASAASERQSCCINSGNCWCSFWPRCPGSHLGFCPPPPQPDRLVFPVPSPPAPRIYRKCPSPGQGTPNVLTLCWPGWPCMGSWAQASSPEAAGAAGPLPPAVDPQSSWKRPEDLSYSPVQNSKPHCAGGGQ